jgi:hypothetical protein
MGDAAQFAEPANVENGLTNRSYPLRRVEIRSARQHTPFAGAKQ